MDYGSLFRKQTLSLPRKLLEMLLLKVYLLSI